MGKGNNSQKNDKKNKKPKQEKPKAAPKKWLRRPPVRPLAGGRLGEHAPRMAEATISQRYGRRPDKGAPAVAVGGGRRSLPAGV